MKLEENKNDIKFSLNNNHGMKSLNSDTTAVSNSWCTNGLTSLAVVSSDSQTFTYYRGSNVATSYQIGTFTTNLDCEDTLFKYTSAFTCTPPSMGCGSASNGVPSFMSFTESSLKYSMKSPYP